MTSHLAIIGAGRTGLTAASELVATGHDSAVPSFSAHIDEAIRHELRSRLAKLQSGEDPGLSFEEIFVEPLLS